MRFGRTVTSVAPLAPPRGPGPEEADEWPRWRVRHTAAPNTGAGAVHAGEEKEDEFDVVVVANGHYEVPAVPGEAEVPGLGAFPGQVSHSKDYDTPAPFEQKRVLIIGSRWGPRGKGVE